MKAQKRVFAIVGPRPTVCTCPKRDCPRHGDCQNCRDYHLRVGRPKPPYCERKPGLLKRLMGEGARGGKTS